MAAAAVEATVNSTRRPELAVVNPAVTPAGSADADRFTLPANPFNGVRVMALEPLPPLTICKAAGASAMAKSCGAVTVAVKVAVEVRLPEAPVTVKLEALTAAEPVAVSVRVLLTAAVPVAETLAGLNDAVTPAGKPVAVRATVPLKPDCGVTVMVATPVPPSATFTLEAEEVSLKEVELATVNARVACADRAPEVPVTVSVEEPTAAEAEAVSFRVAPVKAADTPLGKPAMVNAGVPVKPFSGVTVIVLEPVAPRPMLKLAGAIARVKLAPGLTVRLSARETEVAA